MSNAEEQTQTGQSPVYDAVLKSILEGEEKQLLPYFLDGAVYLETLDIEVIRMPLRMDRVYKVRYRKKIHILHLEFESSSDGDARYRALEYHTYLFRKYKRPVITVIIYPFEATAAISPLEEWSGDERILFFNFHTLVLRELSAENYVNNHAVGLYSLLPTMQGANLELLNKAIDEMIEYYKDNGIKLVQKVYWLNILLRRAKIVPEEEKQMLEERLSMFDELIENDPKMKKLFAEREARGEAKGLQKAVVTFIKGRFPPLKELAEQKVKKVNDLERLNSLIEGISAASDERVVRAMLNMIAA